MPSSPSLADRLLDGLAERYQTPVIPKCNQCGGILTCVAMGGETARWACADATKRYSSEPGVRSHYAHSVITVPNMSDEGVQVLIDTMRGLINTDFRIQAVLEDAIKSNPNVLGTLEADRKLARV